MAASSCHSRGRMSFRRSIVIVFLTLFWSPAAHATDPERVEWSKDWPHFRLAEGITTLALTGTAFALTFKSGPPEPYWTGGILFDDWVRDKVRSDSGSTQQAWADFSDATFTWGTILPPLFDVWVVAFGVHENAEVGGQMLLIDLQSFGLSAVLSLGTQRFTGRARPYTDRCAPDGTTRSATGEVLANRCFGSEDNQSFYSGHTAAIATSAGLTCVHHQHLPLYGGGVADLAPCVVMLGLTAANGVGRLVSDNHYASDVILGMGIGLASGYILPSVLHYGFGGGRAVGAIETKNAVMVPVPQVYPGGGGLGMAGAF
jgi:membrane-associated phospholipid phosphatase